MNATALLRDLYEHMEWADALAWGPVLRHSTLRNDSVIRGRLHHIHLVQRAFLHVWRGEPLVFEGTDTLPSERLAEWGRLYHVDVSEFVSALADGALDDVVHLPWAGRIAETQATPFVPPRLGDTVMQVAVHSAHHRGQVLARIHELGVVPPGTDYIAWVWLGRPAPAWSTITSV